MGGQQAKGDLSPLDIILNQLSKDLTAPMPKIGAIDLLKSGEVKYIIALADLPYKPIAISQPDRTAVYYQVQNSVGYNSRNMSCGCETHEECDGYCPCMLAG
jgi:hypothetical protein